MNRIVSLFDYTGSWPAPFEENGWDAYTLDIKDGIDVLFYDSVEQVLTDFEDINGILAAPPCTHFTVSGAQYWGVKDEDGRTKKALELVYQVFRFADLIYPTDPDYLAEMNKPFFWCFENPVGRLPKLIPGIGKPKYFDPCDYAGHLDLTDSDHNELDRIRRKDAKGVTKEEVEFVVECNAYTKKTGLWGDFNRNLEVKRIEPVRVCKQGSPIQRLGGKSEKTKRLRSITPAGFAKAFFEANKEYQAEMIEF
ncbi:hypothetical protein [Gracilimonas sediminicola]|uniref:hypothetical protein n=1 Tax=Gracilimonas sediminicola TaxID=2952158 RepID=UPI0038D43710